MYTRSTVLCTKGVWPKRLITISGSVHVRIVQTNLELIHHSHQLEDYCMTVVHHYSLDKRERHKDLKPDDSCGVTDCSLSECIQHYLSPFTK